MQYTSALIEGLIEVLDKEAGIAERERARQASGVAKFDKAYGAAGKLSRRQRGERRDGPASAARRTSARTAGGSVGGIVAGGLIGNDLGAAATGTFGGAMAGMASGAVLGRTAGKALGQYSAGRRNKRDGQRMAARHSQERSNTPRRK